MILSKTEAQQIAFSHEYDDGLPLQDFITFYQSHEALRYKLDVITGFINNNPMIKDHPAFKAQLDLLAT